MMQPKTLWLQKPCVYGDTKPPGNPPPRHEGWVETPVAQAVSMSCMYHASCLPEFTNFQGKEKEHNRNFDELLWAGFTTDILTLTPECPRLQKFLPIATAVYEYSLKNVDTKVPFRFRSRFMEDSFRFLVALLRWFQFAVAVPFLRQPEEEPIEIQKICFFFQIPEMGDSREHFLNKNCFHFQSSKGLTLELCQELLWLLLSED